MNQTNTDYLFQLFPPPADRTATVARIGDDAAAFSNHLSYASASVFDVLPRPGHGESANRSQQRDYTGESPQSGDSNRLPESSAATPVPGSSANSESALPTESDTSAGAATADQAVEEEHANDEHTNETAVEAAAGVAGASQEASKQAAIKDRGQKGAREASTLAKDKLEVDTAKNSGEKNDAEKAAENQSPASALVEGEEAHVDQAVAVETVVNDTTMTGTDGKPATDAADLKNLQNPRNAKNAAKAKGEVAQTSPQTDSPAVEVANSANTIDSPAESTQLDTAAIATVKSEEPESDADDSDPTDDGARRVEKSTDRVNGRTEATAAAKLDATPVVGAIAAELAESTGDTGTSKKRGESATKPVAGKHETAVGPLARAMRAASEMTRNVRSEGANDLPQVDPARFVGRVAKAFQTANERGGSLQLRLSPPELGSLKLQLTVKDGVMSAALETDNAGARRLLLDHLPALRDRLAEQNIRVERFDVDVRQENSGGQADPRGFHENPFQQQTERTEARRGNAVSRRAAESVPPEQPVAMPQIGSDGINLVI